MVIEPSAHLWARVRKAIEQVREGVYDMDVVNKLVDGTVLMLPGRYVGLNSHWEDWGVPDWFRDEEDEERQGWREVREKEEVEEMGKALEVISENMAVAAEEEGETAELEVPRRMEKRQVRDVDVEAVEKIPLVAPKSEPQHQQDILGSSSESESGTQGQSHTADATTPIAIATPECPPPDIQPPIQIQDEIEEALPTPTTAIEQQNELNHNHNPPQSQPLNPNPNTDTQLKPVKKEKEKASNTTLRRLYKQTAVLHFTAIGKPWMVDHRELRALYPDAHPLLFEQFRMWRSEAVGVCPLPFEEAWVRE